VVRVGEDFAAEYPDADVASTEGYSTLVRTGTALLLELDRCILASFDVAHPVVTALAVLEGADRPLTPSEIGERVLVASATMTSTLDVLERRGWVERRPNPDDRRSVLVAITAEGRAATDQFLPGIREVERRMMSGLTPMEREQFVVLLGKVLTRAAEMADEPPVPLDGRRVKHRPPTP